MLGNGFCIVLHAGQNNKNTSRRPRFAAPMRQQLSIIK